MPLSFRRAALNRLVAISAALLLTASLLTMGIVNREISRRFEENSNLMLSHSGNLIKEELFRTGSLLKFFSRPDRIDNLREYSELIVSQISESAFLALGYSDGSYYFSDAREMPASYDPRNQNWYLPDRPEKGEAVWSDLFLDYLNQDIVISASLFTLTEDGRQATLAVMIPVHFLADLFVRMNEDYLGFILLTDSKGKVLMSQENRFIGYDIPGAFSEGGFSRAKIEGEWFLINGMKLETADMMLFALLPEAVMGSQIKRIIGQVLALELLLLLIYVLLIFFMLTSLLCPLNQFANMMKKVESGNFSDPMKKWPYRELDDLYRAFRDMVDTIEDRNAVLKTREIKIKDLAYYDSLTKLPNRLLLKKELRKILEENVRGSLMYIDLDRFKIINDTMGHSTGDKVLKEIGKRLLANIRPGQIAARLGGDEFILVLPHVEDMDIVTRIADRVLDQLNAPVTIKSNAFVTGASIGIVLFPVHGRDEDILLKKADMAMYKAKQNGKNNWKLFEEHLEQDNLDRLQIKTGIREGLNKGLFQVYYQPQVDGKTRRVSGLEALLRFGDSSLKDVSVEDVINIAEETGHIVELETFVLNEVVRFSREYFRLKGETIPVSVNISPLHIMHKDFVGNVLEILSKIGLPTNPIELEITEYTMLNSHQDTLDKLLLLNDRGVNLHLDDFGTGYSSLNYLQDLPISYVKIDRSFIAQLGKKEKTDSIISLIIQLSHRLGLKVIAEGVETESQHDLLKAMDCDFIQGYLFHQPMPGEVLLYGKIKPPGLRR